VFPRGKQGGRGWEREQKKEKKKSGLHAYAADPQKKKDMLTDGAQPREKKKVRLNTNDSETEQAWSRLS